MPERKYKRFPEWVYIGLPHHWRVVLDDVYSQCKCKGITKVWNERAKRYICSPIVLMTLFKYAYYLTEKLHADEQRVLEVLYQIDPEAGYIHNKLMIEDAIKAISPLPPEEAREIIEGIRGRDEEATYLEEYAYIIRMHLDELPPEEREKAEEELRKIEERLKELKKPEERGKAIEEYGEKQIERVHKVREEKKIEKKEFIQKTIEEITKSKPHEEKIETGLTETKTMDLRCPLGHALVKPVRIYFRFGGTEQILTTNPEKMKQFLKETKADDWGYCPYCFKVFLVKDKRVVEPTIEELGTLYKIYIEQMERVPPPERRGKKVKHMEKPEAEAEEVEEAGEEFEPTSQQDIVRMAYEMKMRGIEPPDWIKRIIERTIENWPRIVMEYMTTWWMIYSVLTPPARAPPIVIVPPVPPTLPPRPPTPPPYEEIGTAPCKYCGRTCKLYRYYSETYGTYIYFVECPVHGRVYYTEIPPGAKLKKKKE